MEKLTLTTLRHQLFQVADHVLRTGIPVAIERRGKTLLLVPEARRRKLASLRRRRLIRGSARTLVNQKVAQWREPENLA